MNDKFYIIDELEDFMVAPKVSIVQHKFKEEEFLSVDSWEYFHFYGSFANYKDALKACSEIRKILNKYSLKNSKKRKKFIKRINDYDHMA